jgi:tetratricopeptide (TPR) repeat protein
MAQLSSVSDKSFQLGKLQSDRGDFTSAIQNLREAAKGYYSERNFKKYLDCQNLLLRIFAEKEQIDQIQLLKESLQDLVLKEGFELNSKTHYTLALCASYKGQHDTALEYLQKSLAIALATDSKEDICYAISGLVATYMAMGRFEDALKEIYNLQVFFQVLDIAELRISSQMNNAVILAELKKYDQALDILWQTYDIVRSEKSLLLHIHLLTSLGWVYSMAGDKDMARVYLRLASQTCDPENLVYRAKFIQAELDKLGDSTGANFDLVFDLENHTVIEKRLGKVDFKNQFVLLDLLKLFVQNQGQVYSKEYLVEHVWKQSYDPAVHDNKIYVTIKRLRKMIEPDYDKPKYIFRAKNGYFMNKSAKVHLDQRGLS